MPNTKPPLLQRLAAFLAQFTDQSSYGLFHGGDPRNFFPDPECSTGAEREAHRQACAAWDRGEQVDPLEQLAALRASAPKPAETQGPRRRLCRFEVVESDRAPGVVSLRVRSALGAGIHAEGADRDEARAALKKLLADWMAAQPSLPDEAPDAGYSLLFVAPAGDPEPPPVPPTPGCFGLGSYTMNDPETDELLAEVRAAILAESLKTYEQQAAADPATLPMQSVGTCTNCGYQGPGPGHECTAFLAQALATAEQQHVESLRRVSDLRARLEHTRIVSAR